MAVEAGNMEDQRVRRVALENVICCLKDVKICNDTHMLYCKRICHCFALIAMLKWQKGTIFFIVKVSCIVTGDVKSTESPPACFIISAVLTQAFLSFFEPSNLFSLTPETDK